MVEKQDWRLSRVGAGIMCLGGVVLWAYSFMAQPSRNPIYLGALMLGPMCALLGLGGSIDLRILRSLRPEGKQLPFTYQAIAGVLALGGLAISAIRVYQVLPALGLR
jgi:hypothetical protein